MKDMCTLRDKITGWLTEYAVKANMPGFVIGVSGGVDSALVSTLCVLTGLKTVLVEMPINRKHGPIAVRAAKHCTWLLQQAATKPRCGDVQYMIKDLSASCAAFEQLNPEMTELEIANSRSRERMKQLYAIAGRQRLLVAGTGNKIEDIGIGFFTKYGDGGVDLSPIGGLMKSEVRELAAYLGVAQEIVDAVPTDELWDDTRSDEAQIGATYDELEWAMTEYEAKENPFHPISPAYYATFTDRQRTVMDIFEMRHNANAHKNAMPPVCPV